jgi:hypothetical protein
VYTQRGARQLDAARVRAVEADADVERERLRAETAAAVKVAAAAAKVEADRIKAAARAERAASREARRAAASRHAARPYVRGMLVACLIAAWPGQYLYLAGLDLHPVMAATLTTVVEGMAWVGIRLTEQGIGAPEGPRPVGRYRAMTWGAASIAAVINLVHGSSEYSAIVGVALAMASLGGPFVHGMYAHAESAAASGASGEEIRLAITRRTLHYKVSREARRLRAAVGLEMTTEAAWILAWRSVHGADPGVTAKSLERHHEAADRVRELIAARPLASVGVVSALALQTPSADLSALAPGGSVPDATDAVRVAADVALEASGPVRALLGTDADAVSGGDDASRPVPVRPAAPHPGPRPADTRPAKATDIASVQVAASEPPVRSPGSALLREAAADSVRTASEDQRDEARTWIADRIRTDLPVAWADVRDDVAVLWGRSRTWYTDLLAEVRRASEPRLHAVPDDPDPTRVDLPAVPLPLDGNDASGDTR